MGNTPYHFLKMSLLIPVSGGNTGPNSSPCLWGQGNCQQSSLALVSILRGFTFWAFCCLVVPRGARQISSWLWIYMEVHQCLALAQSMNGDESIDGGFWNTWSPSWHFEIQDICKRMRDVSPEAKTMNVNSDLMAQTFSLFDLHPVFQTMGDNV